MKKAAILCATVCLVLLSCAPPPYSDPFSVSAAVLARFTPESTIGPVSKDETDIVFAPEKTGQSGISFDRGFVGFNHAGQSDFCFIQSRQAGIYNLSRRWGLGSPDLSPGYPFFLLRAVTEPDEVSITAFDPFVPQNSTISFAAYDATADSLSVVRQSPLLSYIAYPAGSANPPPVVVGGGFLPGAAADADWAYWLVRIPATGGSVDRYAERATPLSESASSMVVSDQLDLSAFMPPGLNRCMYFHDPLRAPYASYVSFRVKETWQTWKWTVDAAGAVTASQLAVSGRVDALLTNGLLLVTDGAANRLRIYDPSGSGTERSSFPLGDLSFAFEAYQNDTARVFFTQILVLDSQVYLKPYSIATSELAPPP